MRRVKHGAPRKCLCDLRGHARRLEKNQSRGRWGQDRQVLRYWVQSVPKFRTDRNPGT